MSKQLIAYRFVDSIIKNEQKVSYHVLIRLFFDDTTSQYDYDAILIETNYSSFQELYKNDRAITHKFKIFTFIFQESYYYKIIAHTTFTKKDYPSFSKYLSLQQQETLYEAYNKLFCE